MDRNYGTLTYEDLVNNERNFTLANLNNLIPSVIIDLEKFGQFKFGDLTISIDKDADKDRIKASPYDKDYIYLCWTFIALGKKYGAYTVMLEEYNEEGFKATIEMTFVQIVETMLAIKKELDSIDFKFILDNHSVIKIVENTNTVEINTFNPFGNIDKKYMYLSRTKKWSGEDYSDYIVSVLTVDIPQVTSDNDSNLSMKEILEQGKYKYTIRNHIDRTYHKKG